MRAFLFLLILLFYSCSNTVTACETILDYVKEGDVWTCMEEKDADNVEELIIKRDNLVKEIDNCKNSNTDKQAEVDKLNEIINDLKQ